MTTYANRRSQAQRHSSGNPWGAFVPHWSLEGYTDPPTDDLTLQNALTVWRREFGDSELELGVQDSMPLQQGPLLGTGGIGIVHETKIAGIAMAWKRIYTRSHTERERYHNEVKILSHMTEQRHKHIVNLIGSYTRRLRNSNYELAILTWPVARCDLSVLLREVDLINEWKSRDETWKEDVWATQPTDDEKTAFENLLSIEHLEQDQSTPFTWHLRERALGAILQRLTRSIGCIAEAVTYLHENKIRHKDIKPSQILVSSDGLWLTDFGWSRDISQLTSSETSGGDRITVRYHAPERTQMNSCGRSEDIFSLGCTFLEMGYRICGERLTDYLNPTGTPMWSFQANLSSMNSWLTPFRSESLSLKSFLAGVIERMMAYEAYERPKIGEVVEILQLYSRYNLDSFFGQCCVPHQSLRVFGNGNPSDLELTYAPPADRTWSFKQLSETLKRHGEEALLPHEDNSSTATAYSNRDINNEEPELYVKMNDEKNRVEAPITRFVRMLHEAQSLELSSPAESLRAFSSDGIAILCMCGWPGVTGNDIQCNQCGSWQHMVCYYAEQVHRAIGHECLMCDSEATRLMPTRTESPSRLRISRSASTTDLSGIIDRKFPGLLRDTARAIYGLSKSGSDHTNSVEMSPTKSRQRKDVEARHHHQSTRNSNTIEPKTLELSGRKSSMKRILPVPLDQLSQMAGPFATRKIVPVSGVQTRCGPRASTPQIPMRQDHGGPPDIDGDTITNSPKRYNEPATNQARNLNAFLYTRRHGTHANRDEPSKQYKAQNSQYNEA